MIAASKRRLGALSWQTMLADLALILFMVTAMAMGQPAAQSRQTGPARTQNPSTPPPAASLSSRGQALALWRETPESPSLAAWLAAQAADPRQQLTLSARYRPGHLADALAEADRLADTAGAMGRSARIVAEPSAAGGDLQVEIAASLAFDRTDVPADAPNEALARGLLNSGHP